jgi:hypothetical protein
LQAVKGDQIVSTAVPDPAFNLTELGDRLLAEKRLLPLAGKIRRARDIHSLSADLMMAIESLDALDVLLAAPTAPEGLGKIITESALLNNALVLYGRATKTTSQIRGGFDLRSRFNEDERVVHEELSDFATTRSLTSVRAEAIEANGKPNLSFFSSRARTQSRGSPQGGKR